MKLLEHKIPPPILLLVIAAMMCLAARWLPVFAVDPRLRYALLVFLFVFGLIVGGSGIRAFVRAKTTINPVQIDQASQLVTRGIFSYTRNPMYVGLTIILLTLAVYLSAPWTLLGPVFFAVFIHRFQILPEERAMRSKFGREYDEYRIRVRRWL